MPYITPSLSPLGRSLCSSFIIAPSDLSLSVGRSHRGIAKREPTHWADPLNTLLGGCYAIRLECQTLADNTLKFSLEVEPDTIDITVDD